MAQSGKPVPMLVTDTGQSPQPSSLQNVKGSSAEAERALLRATSATERREGILGNLEG